MRVKERNSKDVLSLLYPTSLLDHQNKVIEDSQNRLSSTTQTLPKTSSNHFSETNIFIVLVVVTLLNWLVVALAKGQMMINTGHC